MTGPSAGMRVDLYKPAQAECSHMAPGLAHRLGGDAKITVFYLRVRDGDGGDDGTAIGVEYAIEITYLLYAARVFCKLVEHDGPDMVGNDNHAGRPL
jgi:hypothetical protein